ncbi:MAG: hypothetical protein QHH02_00020 [Syntrophomonadaceae bacterium]|nr:hypothetical protein [Syntrophomonadaceae bacterium]
MGWLLVLILGGILVALLLRSNAENSYRRGFEDGLKERRRQDSIDVEYRVIEPDEERSP